MRLSPIPLAARLRRSKTAVNFGWLVADRAVRLGLSVIVGFWVARYLGPAGFGTLSYVLAGVALLGPVAELGFDAVARREFVRRPAESAVIAGTVCRLRAGGAVVAFGGVALYALLAPVSTVEREMFLIVGATLFQPALQIAEAWLQSRLAARQSVLPQWIALLAGAAARLAAIRLGAPLVVFAWIVAAETALAMAWLLLAARRSGFRLGRMDPATARALFRESWPLALSSVAVIIYMRIDVLMLRSMAGAATAGIYSAAVRLSELGYFLPTAAAISLQPALVRIQAGDPMICRTFFQRYFSASALAAYLLAGAATAAAPAVIRWFYGAPYAGAAPVLMIHVWAMVFVFLGVARGQYLVNAGLTRIGWWFTAAGALCNVGLNFVLIPRWGGVGAAWATVASYAVAAWLSSFFHRETRWIAFSQMQALLAPWRLRAAIRVFPP